MNQYNGLELDITNNTLMQSLFNNNANVAMIGVFRATLFSFPSSDLLFQILMTRIRLHYT